MAVTALGRGLRHGLRQRHRRALHRARLGGAHLPVDPGDARQRAGFRLADGDSGRENYRLHRRAGGLRLGRGDGLAQRVRRIIKGVMRIAWNVRRSRL